MKEKLTDGQCVDCSKLLGCPGVMSCDGFVRKQDAPVFIPASAFIPATAKGIKNDEEKLDWYALPFEILEPLAELMLAGERKYGTFNCLEHFENSNRRFWSANMRHAISCQQDPLAIDEETGCYHEACRAFSSLMRIYHAKKERANGC